MTFRGPLACYCPPEGRSVCGGTASERVGKGKAISIAYARGILLSPLSSLSSLSSSSSLSPLSSLFFLSSLPQVATGVCKNAPRVERKPCHSIRKRQGLERKPCLLVSVPCSRWLSINQLVMFKQLHLWISKGLFCDLFSLLASLCALKRCFRMLQG